MTEYEVKEKLEQARNLKRELLAKERLLEELRTRAEKITPTLSDLPKAQSNGSRVESFAILIVELGLDIEEYSIELVNAIQDAESLIRIETDALKRSILTDYYLNRLSVARIAEQEHYSDRRIWQLLSEARRDIARMIS